MRLNFSCIEVLKRAIEMNSMRFVAKIVKDSRAISGIYGIGQSDADPQLRILRTRGLSGREFPFCFPRRCISNPRRLRADHLTRILSHLSRGVETNLPR